MAGMTTSGCDVSSIADRQYQTVQTERALSIIHGLDCADIAYFAKYDEQQLMLVYSAADSDKVSEILNRAALPQADLIERIRSEESSEETYKSLVPEIAAILNISASHLESRPFDLQMILAQTYINYWNSDSATIKSALGLIMALNDETLSEIEGVHQMQEAANNTPEVRRDIHEAEQRLAEAAQQERLTYQQQQDDVTAEQERTGYISRQQRKRMAQSMQHTAHQERIDMDMEERERKK